jgi:hypothetical protein
MYKRGSRGRLRQGRGRHGWVTTKMSQHLVFHSEGLLMPTMLSLARATPGIAPRRLKRSGRAPTRGNDGQPGQHRPGSRGGGERAVAGPLAFPHLSTSLRPGEIYPLLWVSPPPELPPPGTGRAWGRDELDQTDIPTSLVAARWGAREWSRTSGVCADLPALVRRSRHSIVCGGQRTAASLAHPLLPWRPWRNVHSGKARSASGS